ncbi:MAG TPA: histidine kinase [Chitinophagaceae bacterium]|jgi:hypothetical protein|nr:histidine kinase [Chitinophagaceae bacterium]
MQWHKLIFSEQKQIRLLRHLLFWASWTFYFLLYNYLVAQPRPVVSGGPIPTSPIKTGTRKTGYIILESEWFIKTLLLITLYVVACYIFIYLVLPQLIKGKWLSSTVRTIALCIFLFVAAWILYWNVFPFIDSLHGDPKVNDYFARFWPPFYLGIVNAGKVIVFAAIITYVKYWWVKQKEKEKLEREKLNAELQLLKAQVHPDFLFKTLNNIYDYANNNSPHTSAMLAKLSDLLSYMLYDCDNPLVPLDKEIAMMKDYMEMEKIKYPDSFEMGLTVRGDASNKIIAPFLLLPFIENSFKQTSALNENIWLNMDVEIEDNLFFMKLANSIAPKNGSPEIKTNDLNDAQKRLTLIYPGHELKIYREQEMLITHLKIQLNDTTETVEKENEKPVMEEVY